MTMSTTFVEAAYPLPAPPPIPPIAPRPLGIWRALGWTTLAALASLTGPFLYGIFIGFWNLAHPTQPMPLPDGSDSLANSIILAFMLAGFFTVILVACRCSGWRVADYLALARPHGAWLRLGALAFVVPFAVIVTANYFDPPASMALPKTTLALALGLIGMMVIAPICEELFFRGFLFRALAASRLGAAGAIVITALVWAGLHINKSWPGMAAMLFTGIVWGFVRWRTQSTLATMAVHALNNLVAGTALAIAALAGMH